VVDLKMIFIPWTHGEPRMPKLILRLLFCLILGFVIGVIGLIIGTLIGGNFATDFTFNGVRGYEATGQLGFIIGALTGMIVSWWYLFKRKS